MLNTHTYFLGFSFLVAALISHEIGHAVCFQTHRVRMAQIGLGSGPTLFRFGRFEWRIFPIGAFIVPNPSDWRSLSAWQRADCALAGPMCNLIVGLVLATLSFHTRSVELFEFAATHFALVVFNLIPVPPLDGWFVLEALMEKVGRPLSNKHRELALRAGNGLIYGLGFAYLTYWAVAPMKG